MVRLREQSKSANDLLRSKGSPKSENFNNKSHHKINHKSYSSEASLNKEITVRGAQKMNANLNKANSRDRSRMTWLESMLGSKNAEKKIVKTTKKEPLDALWKAREFQRAPLYKI
jgi:hypothetical protein